MGCLAPIANPPKTVVNYPLDHLLATENLAASARPSRSRRRPSWLPASRDERDLMPYAVLDARPPLHASVQLAFEIAAVLGFAIPEYDARRRYGVEQQVRQLVCTFDLQAAPLSLHLGNPIWSASGRW